MNSGAGEIGWRGWSLLVVTIGCAVAAFLVPAMPQPLGYHDFADERAWLGIPNFQNVASNLPFLFAGGWGLWLLSRGGGSFIEPRERVPYVVFFLGALLTCFGSGYYHLSPANEPLVWDRLPMTLGFAGLVSAALAERVHLGLGLRVLWALLALGVLSVSYWAATERAGVGNVMPYGIYQGWAVLMIILVLLCYPARRYDRGYLLIWAAVWYGLAKLFETYDDQVHALTGERVSGHAIKHVLAALGVFAIVWQLRLRRPAQAASIPAA